MTYNINRDLNFKVIKKNVTITNSINPVSLTESLGSTKSTEFLHLTSLSINSIPVLATANQLNYLQTTPGIGNKNKALIVNSSRNISNINTISCNGIMINGNLILSNNDLYGGISDDINNSYLTNIISGIGQANKALILDSKLSISNINKLSTNQLIYKNTYINTYNNKKISINNLNDNTITYKSIIDKSLTNVFSNFNTNTTLGSLQLTHICWSPDLELFVAVCRSSNNYDYSKIYTSTNGFDWITVSHPLQQNHLSSIIWSNNYKIFITTVESISAILISTNGIDWITINLANAYNYVYEVNNYLVLLGGTNQIAISQDGYNWSYVNFNLNSNILSGICWANSLNLYVLTATSGTDSNKIYISHDCINWIDVKMNYFTNSSQGFQYIVWSEELNTLVATGTNTIFYSNNGTTWNRSNYIDNGIPTFTDLEWNSDIQAFLALDNSSTHLFISYDGITWLRYNNTSYIYSKLVWCNKYGMIGLLNSTRMGFIYINKNKTNFNNTLFKINYSTNCVGLNYSNPQTALDINANDGKCLRICNVNSYNYDYNINNYFGDFNIVDNGKLNIDSYTTTNNYTPFSVYIYTNFSTYGLKLNNILIKTSITDFNRIKNLTPGIASLNKALMCDSNLNISNINSFSCQSLIINNSEVTSSSFNNNPFLQNATIGTAYAEKALIVDGSLNINNINLLNSKKCIFNSYTKLYSNTFLNNNVNINQLQYMNNKKTSITTLNNNTKWNVKTFNNQQSEDLCWCPELNIFVSCGYNYIGTSKDGINWTSAVLPNVNYPYKSICWSSKLSLFVVVSYNTVTFNIFTSKDGLNWNTQFNPYSNLRPIKVIWVEELNIFIIIGNAGTITRNLISYDGEFWVGGNLSTSYTWTKIIWASHLNTFICTAQNSTIIAKSINGLTWTYVNINTTPSISSGFYYLAYSKELNIIVTGYAYDNLYSYDGINWAYVSTVEYLAASNLYWISDLKMFISVYSDRFAYSTDGINFNSRIATFSGNNAMSWNNLAWSPSLNILIASTNTGTYRLLYSDIINTQYSRSTLYSHKSQMYLNKSNGNLGLGTLTPNYQLELSTDNAKKPSTNTWTITSDSRLKENIENADLNICYNILKNLKLKKYKWKDTMTNYNNIKDKHKLGWIADEVEEYFPKSILIKKNNNLDDCKNLDIDQIVSIMYGSTQKIINNYENLNNEINNIQNKLNNIQNFINNLI